jgi:hypothetical protein
MPKIENTSHHCAAYLLRPIRTLRTVCRDTGRDDDGRACATFTLRDLCALIERRLGALTVSN